MDEEKVAEIIKEAVKEVFAEEGEYDAGIGEVSLRDFDTRVDTGKSEVFDTPNDEGYVQKWLVNIIFQTNTGIVDKESPLHKKFLTMPHAEFYSMDTNQFVSAYYIKTLLEDAPGLSAEGLDLHGGVPAWSIEGKYMREILNWLRSVVNEVEAPKYSESI